MSEMSTERTDSAVDMSVVLEQISEDVHNTWCELKTEKGWVYGEELNVEAKTHPDLIPYSELTEEKKDLDRGTVRTVLESLERRGYKIVFA